MIYVCKSEENPSTGSKDIHLQVYDTENEVKVTKIYSALKLVTMIYLYKFGENPSTGSKDIPLTRL